MTPRTLLTTSTTFEQTIGSQIEATHSQNRRNQVRSSSNTSGRTGVVWAKREMRWQAAIRENGRKKFLGYFDQFEDAVAARVAAEQRLGYTIHD